MEPIVYNPKILKELSDNSPPPTHLPTNLNSSRSSFGKHILKIGENPMHLGYGTPTNFLPAVVDAQGTTITPAYYKLYK